MKIVEIVAGRTVSVNLDNRQRVDFFMSAKAECSEADAKEAHRKLTLRVESALAGDVLRNFKRRGSKGATLELISKRYGLNIGKDPKS